MGVEQPRPVRAEEPDSLAADDVDRPAVGEVGERRAERLAAAPGELAGGRGGPRPAEGASDLVGAGRVEELEELPRVVVPVLDIGRVLGVALDTPGADRDDGGQARSYEVGEDLELFRLEGEARLVAVDRDPRGAEDVVVGTTAQQRGEPDREVCDLRAEADVAEVDDCRDPAAVVEEDVAEVQVAVDDLRAER